MQLTLKIFLPCIFLAGCASKEPTMTPIVVEVWKQSDVGPANRLFDELERKITASSDFRLAKFRGEGKFQIVVTEKFQEAGFQTYRYHVNFVTGFPAAPMLIGSSTGICGERNMARCADTVLVDARRQIQTRHEFRGHRIPLR